MPNTRYINWRNKTCKDCEYALAGRVRTSQYYCHRHPPNILIESNNNLGILSYYSLVGVDPSWVLEACAEFQPKIVDTVQII